MRTRRVCQLGRLALSDPPSDNFCRPGRLLDRSPDASFHICSSFLRFCLLIRIDRDFLNDLVMVIFLDLDDESLLGLHVVLRSHIDYRVHDLIGKMRHLMLSLQLELVTRLLLQTDVMLQACEMFLRPFLPLCRWLWLCQV
jgi:hypothetical protein